MLDVFTPTQTTGEMAETLTPRIRRTVADTSSSTRSRWRSIMSGRGFSREQVEVVIPKGSAGRPKGVDVPFKGLSKPVRAAIVAALGFDAFPVDSGGWSSVGDVDHAATAILDHFENLNSASSALSAFRSGLRAIGVDEKLIETTLRPDLSLERNRVGDLRTAERADEGLTPPEPFRTIAGLRDRVDGYLADGVAWVPDGQAAADLLVTLSARPGEAETLTIGDRGGVTGVLKKKNAGESYPIVSALGEGSARSLLVAWKRVSAKARAVAMRSLKGLTQEWGIQRRDLRAIGAHLAGRAAQLEGGALNPTQIRAAVQGALRHEPVGTAVEHYTRVVDPAPALAAMFAEMSPEKQAQVLALMAE